MTYRIGKDFKWEMSHRLPFHQGPCKNIHGHSYKMRIELEGSLNNENMVLDYYEIENIINPLIKELDHAFLCDSNDNLMTAFLKENGFKYYIMDEFSTAENISLFILNKIAPQFVKFDNLQTLRVRIYETDDAFAEIERKLG